MKIRKLHIKNYKVFNDLQLDFTDANGNTLDKIVLAGVNGCGKTTVLEIIKNIYNGSILRSIGTSDSIIEMEVELLNNISHSGKYLHMTYSKDKVSGIENILNNQYFDSTKLFYLPTKPSETEIAKYQTIYLDTLKSEMKAFALKGIRDEVFKNENTPPRESKANAIKQITKALNGMNLTTKLVDLESEELIFESANGQKIKFEDLSNGEQNLYFRAIYLSKLNPKDSIIMVDEPEDSLHPTWQQKVVQLYQNIGENNQVIVATHSPHIIGASKAEEVFLLEIDENQVEAKHPIYTKGHSVKHILRAMGTDPNDIEVINKVDAYMALMRNGAHETKEGLQLKAEIDALNLDPNSEEMRRLDLSIKRFKTVGVWGIFKDKHFTQLYKQNYKLLLNPTAKNISALFSYENGIVEPSKKCTPIEEQQVKYTIKRLNLDAKTVEDNRKTEIDTINELLEDLTEEQKKVQLLSLLDETQAVLNPYFSTIKDNFGFLIST